jgi:hypothetical protein
MIGELSMDPRGAFVVLAVKLGRRHHIDDQQRLSYYRAGPSTVQTAAAPSIERREHQPERATLQHFS